MVAAAPCSLLTVQSHQVGNESVHGKLRKNRLALVDSPAGRGRDAHTWGGRLGLSAFEFGY